MQKTIKVLISGGNGLIGTYLCSYFDKKKIEYKKINLRNLNKNYKNFTHFLHLQFFISKNKKIKYLNKNISVIKKIVNKCENDNMTLVFFSTCSADLKISDYTISKKRCEQVITESSKKRNLTSIILRIFNVYTPNIYSRGAIPELIKKMKKLKKINIDYFNNFRDFIYIDDLTTLIKKIFSLKETCKLEVGTGQAVKIIDLARYIKSTFKFNCEITKSKKVKSRCNSFSRANIKHLKNKLDWYPKISLKDGLKKIYKLNK